jgi:hypothetical protein
VPDERHEVLEKRAAAIVGSHVERMGVCEQSLEPLGRIDP